MHCPFCGAADLEHDTRDLPYTWRGRTTTLPAIEGDWCAACGEGLIDVTNTDRFLALAHAFQQRIDAEHAADKWPWSPICRSSHPTS